MSAFEHSNDFYFIAAPAVGRHKNTIFSLDHCLSVLMKHAQSDFDVFVFYFIWKTAEGSPTVE